ncbi:MAG: ABC transporter permease [Chloroflexi bacterium]|nr:ABC transporter permease [Chloroflexota bacterium]
MRIFDLAFKDLVQILRDKKSLLFLVAMPVIFTLFMGFAYNSGENGEVQDPRMPLAWVDSQQMTGLSEALFTHLETSDAVRPVRMEKAEALAALQNGDVDGVLVVPSGFGEQATGGEIRQITLITDTASAKGQSLYQALRVPISRLMSAVEIARISVGVVGSPDEFAPAFALAWGKWKESASQSPVRMEQAVAQESESLFGDNPYNQASPGILVQFAILGLVTSAQILVQERKSRTLQRLMTTAMKPWEIVAGHMLAMFAVVFLQTAVLVIFGQWILDVNYLHEPLGVLLVLVALGLWVSSMGLLIGFLAEGDDQVIMFSMIAMFVFSALGGTWFPLEAAGGAFAAIGKTMPSAWAMVGLQNILIRNLGLQSVWMPTSVLFVYALVFFLIAVWQFRRSDM